MKSYLAVLLLFSSLWFVAPAMAQDSSRLNTMEHKVSRSVRKEARLRKKAARQQRKLSHKEKKLSQQEKKTERRARKRNREQRKLDKQQRDSTTLSQIAYAFYRKEELPVTIS